MGTYALVALIALVLIALMLRYGPSLRPARAEVLLPDNAGWSGAVLSGADTQIELTPGVTTELTPGGWELRLFADDGSVEDRHIELAPDELRSFGPAR